MVDYHENRIKVPRFKEANGFYTTKDRSKIMSKIRNRDTKPEQKLRKLLWSLGIRYRKNVKSLPGTPDVAIKKYKLAIFIDGEFWHGYNWEEKKDKIKSNRKYWIPKIERNMQRDREVNLQYKEMDWTVLRFWDNEIKKEFGASIIKILEYIEEFRLVNKVLVK